jgi:hypothetical protein
MPRLHRALEFLHVVGADLMAESARAAVNLHRQTARVQSHHLRGVAGKHLIDHVHLDKVIARAQRSQLRPAALLGTFAHL